MASLCQQPLNNHLGLLVVTLPKMVMPNATLRIDEIQSRPVLVLERTPYRVVAVDSDGKGDADLLDRVAHVAEVLLERKFRRVHADHHQFLVLVFVRPSPNVWKGAPPVDAGVGPKLDEHDFPAQL